MKTFTLSFFLLFGCLLLPSSGYACSCFGPSTFCETISGPHSEESLIILGKKIKDVDHGMEVEIKKTFRGKEEKRVITVWGDPGHLCRVYASHFEMDVLYVFAFDRLTQEDPSAQGWQGLERIGDYSISVCGRHYWKCDGMDGQLETANEIEACLGSAPCDEDDANLHLYPNPTQETLQVSVSGLLESPEGTVTIFDALGKKVKYFSQMDEVYDEGVFSFGVNDMASGIYIIQVDFPGVFAKSIHEKFVKI